VGEQLVSGATKGATTGAAGAQPRELFIDRALAALAAVAPVAGVVGAVAITLGSVAAAVVYQGTEGEAYSPLNHWISELGQLGVSSLAMIFNAGLMIGGASLAIFMLGLAASRTGRLRYAFGPIGAISGIAGIFVGVAPMNYIGPHTIAAQTFFNLGWIAVGLASIDFIRHPDMRFPRWLSVLGGLTVAVFIAFLIVFYQPDATTGHPPFRLVMTLEWLVLAGMIGWVFLASWRWLRARGAW
jgi:hypothetical membrane protein